MSPHVSHTHTHTRALLPDLMKMSKGSCLFVLLFLLQEVITIKIISCLGDSAMLFGNHGNHGQEPPEVVTDTALLVDASTWTGGGQWTVR